MPPARSFFPLAVHFPFALYRKCHPVGRGLSLLMGAIWWSLLAVAVGATLGCELGPWPRRRVLRAPLRPAPAQC
jgi:hypothetical protein